MRARLSDRLFGHANATRRKHFDGFRRPLRVFMIAEYIAVQILNVIRWGLGAMLATTLLVSVLVLMAALGRVVNLRKLFGAA